MGEETTSTPRVRKARAARADAGMVRFEALIPRALRDRVQATGRDRNEAMAEALGMWLENAEPRAHPTWARPPKAGRPMPG